MGCLGMAGRQLFALSFQHCGSPRTHSVGVKVSRGLELLPGGLLTSVGLSILSYRGVFAQKLGAGVL